MSAFDKIAATQSKVKRKLFDYQISLSGTESKVVVLKIEQNKYKDTEVSIIKQMLTSVVLDIPGEVPISKLRKNLSSPVASTQSVFLYDILPIQIYTKFSDNIEKGDILIQRINMGVDYYYMILEVSETLGNLVGREVIYKKQNAAPYTQGLPEEAVEIINSYMGLMNKDESVELRSLPLTIDTTPNIELFLNTQTLSITTNTITI